MQYNKAPSIVYTDPKRFATNIHVAAKITVVFDSDIDKDSISNNTHLYNESGRPVEIRCSYNNKTLIITPREKLSSEETYRAVIHGDNNPGGTTHDGIQSIVGTYMIGDYDFVFTTKNELNSLECVVNGVPNDVVINTQPVFKFNIARLTGAESVIIEIQLSKSKLFDSIIWTGTGTPEEGATGIKCGLYLTDAVYYWRARVVRAENKGVWSDSFQFHLNTIPRAPIVEDDTLPLDLAFPSDWGMDAPVVLSVFPADSQAAVPVNTRVIAVVIHSIIPVEKIDFDSLYITCEPNTDFTNTRDNSTLGLRTSYGHDDIECGIDVVYNTYDNTTTLILNLKALPESELSDYEHTMPAVYNLVPYEYKRLKPGAANIAYIDYSRNAFPGSAVINDLDYGHIQPASAAIPGETYIAPLLNAEAVVI